MTDPVKEKIILGIDPGTTVMGYGVLKVAMGKPSLIAMGVIDLHKYGNHYLKLAKIHERVLSIIESYLPDELAIEAPFFGKNVQSMLKLGRAQGRRRSKWLVCCNDCCTLPKRICQSSSMQRMPWELPIVISCRWGHLRWRKVIRVGRIL